MIARMDAVLRCKFVIPFVFLIVGCSPLAKRQPPSGQPSGRIEPVKASDLATNSRLANTQDLAITNSSRVSSDGEIRQAAHRTPQTEQPPHGGGDPGVFQRLYRSAAESYSKLPSYIARLRRREAVGGRSKPEEVLVFKYREKPYSVHFKWLGEEGQGREVVYVYGKFDNKLHILTAAGDIPFTPAGRRLSLAPDSMLVKSASRYPITEAGIGNMIARFGRLVDEFRSGHSGVQLKFLGQVQRPEYAAPLECVEATFGPNHEPEIPQGGKKVIYFDPATHFPVISATYDLSGHEVDYYCFDRFQSDIKLDDDDFNPERIWGPAKK